MIFLGPEDTPETWSSSRNSHEAATRGEGAPLPYGPHVTPPTYFFVLYIHIYSKTLRGIHENTFPPPQPSVSVRSHLGTFSGTLPEGDSITEGFYINSIALPMKRE
jgi:hypothetical protein